MRKFKNIVILTIATIITVMTVAGCNINKTDEELINRRIEAFFEAYNAGDMEGGVKCLDSKTKNTYESAMNMTNALIGKTGFSIKLSDIFGVAVGVISEGDLLKASEMNITLTSDETANVNTVLSYSDKTGMGNFAEKVLISMKKEKSDWFIEDIKSEK